MSEVDTAQCVTIDEGKAGLVEKLDSRGRRGFLVAASAMVAGVATVFGGSGFIGRYVCDPAVFPILHDTPPGLGGEIQLTDALKELARTSPENGGGVRGVLLRGNRYDTGNKLGFLKAVVHFALRRPDLASQFTDYLREIDLGETTRSR